MSHMKINTWYTEHSSRWSIFSSSLLVIFPHILLKKEKNSVPVLRLREFLILKLFLDVFLTIFWGIFFPFFHFLLTIFMMAIIIMWTWITWFILTSYQVIVDTYNNRAVIVNTGKLWGHLKDNPYGRLIQIYASLLIKKIEFHASNIRFPGNLAVTDADLDIMGEGDVNV